MSRIARKNGEETRRQVREEVRTALEPVVQEMQGIREVLTDLSERLEAMEKAVRALPLEAKHLSRSTGTPATTKRRKPSRLSAGLIKKLRKRLAISQAELALLVGVSQPAVASWEQDRAKPRRGPRERIIALRALTAMEARQQVEQLQTQK